MQRKQVLRYGVIQESESDMKKPESSERDKYRYRIRMGAEVLGDQLTTQEYCDMMEDIAQQYYEGKLENPLSLTTEICD